MTTGVVLPFIDKAGRRMLLLSGSILCMALHFAIAGTMATYGHYADSVNGNDNLRWVIAGAPGKGVIACSYIFTGIYGLTWVSFQLMTIVYKILTPQAPTAWIYSSEIFPLKYRAKGVGLSAAGNWIFNFALAYFVAPAFTNIQWRTYIIFGVFCTVMTLHVYFLYPETAQRSLEEIDYMFDTGVKAWKSDNVQLPQREQNVKKTEEVVHNERV